MLIAHNSFWIESSAVGCASRAHSLASNPSCVNRKDLLKKIISFLLETLVVCKQLPF